VVSVAAVPKESRVVADDSVSIIIICNIILKIKINNNNTYHYCKNNKGRKGLKIKTIIITKTATILLLLLLLFIINSLLPVKLKIKSSHCMQIVPGIVAVVSVEAVPRESGVVAAIIGVVADDSVSIIVATIILKMKN